MESRKENTQKCREFPDIFVEMSYTAKSTTDLHTVRLWVKNRLARQKVRDRDLMHKFREFINAVIHVEADVQNKSGLLLKKYDTLNAIDDKSEAAENRLSARYALVWDGGFRSRVRATTTAGWPRDFSGAFGREARALCGLLAGADGSLAVWFCGFVWLGPLRNVGGPRRREPGFLGNLWGCCCCCG